MQALDKVDFKLRPGQVMALLGENGAGTSLTEIISYMVGRDIKEKFPRVECELGKKVLEVKHINAGRLVRDFSLEARAGEIVGIAGLVGAGRTETLRAIFGTGVIETTLDVSYISLSVTSHSRSTTLFRLMNTSLRKLFSRKSCLKFHITPTCRESCVDYESKEGF